jgi:plasmid maintenance system killer protein
VSAEHLAVYGGARHGAPRRLPYKRLEILDAATCLEDLRGLPSNRLEALKAIE